MKFSTQLRFATVLAVVLFSCVHSNPIQLLRLRTGQTGSDDDDVKVAQTFDRTSGVSFPIASTVHKHPALTRTMGRTFGQYGSYKLHEAWQKAVFEVKRRHALAFGNLMTPNFGYAIGNFWNSYATHPESQNSDS